MHDLSDVASLVAIPPEATLSRTVITAEGARTSTAPLDAACEVIEPRDRPTGCAAEELAEVDGKTRGQPSLLLRPLGFLDEKQALTAHEELAQDGFEFLFDRDQDVSWPVYCQRLENQRLGLDLPEDMVPATFLVAEAEGQIDGRVSIRHALNAYLAELGGHIGYGVRPGFRRRGHPTAIMRQSLEIAPSMGLTVCW
jgi:GNAT superfamily N-acetyltransferase